MAKPTAGPIARTHPLTGRPILPLGYRADGRTIWPIMGGAPDDPPGGQPPAGGSPTPPAGGAPAPGTPPANTPPAEKIDLSKVSLDDLKAHPSFQSEINRVVGERITREQAAWQKKLDDEKKLAGLDDAGKLQAQLEAAAAETEAARAESKASRMLAVATKAEVLAVAEGGKAERTAAIIGQIPAAELEAAIGADGSLSELALRASVQRVLEKFPEWKTGQAQLPPGTPAASGTSLTPPPPTGRVWKASEVKAMTQEQTVAQWPEIEKAMNEGRFLYEQ